MLWDTDEAGILGVLTGHSSDWVRAEPFVIWDCTCRCGGAMTLLHIDRQSSQISLSLVSTPSLVRIE